MLKIRKKYSINHLENMQEIVENSNCIIKAFEEHDVFIFNDNPKDKKTYYFRASDVAKIIGIVNISSSIQNFKETERCLREVETRSGKKDVIFLTSKGVYRLMYASKKPLAEKFRDWAGDILDDIIFNSSEELEKKLKEKNDQLLIQTEQLKISEEKNMQLVSKITDINIQKIDGWIYLATTDQYALNNHFRFGRTKNLRNRIVSYQPGRTVADQLYYVYIYRTENAYFLENIVRELLKPYRENPNVDMYVLPWPIIHKFVNYVCNVFHTGIIPQLNDLIIKNVDFISTCEIPNKILISKLVINEDVENNCAQCAVHCFDTEVIVSQECKKCNHHCFSDNIDLDINVVDLEIKTIEHNGIVYKESNTDEAPIIMRVCRTCTINKACSFFEIVTLKGNLKTSCIECINKTQILCKKCNVVKIATEYRFSNNKIRQRKCNACLDIKMITTKICKKCNKEKFSTEYGKYTSGDLHNDCAECYLLVIKRDTKTCRNCKEVLPSDKFKERTDNKRNRICDNCRNI